MPKGGLMHSALFISAVFAFASVGCLTPVTSRLDMLNEHLHAARQQLDTLNGQLTQANQRISHLENQLMEANAKLTGVDGKVSQTNEKLDVANGRLANVERSTKTVEDAAKKITGLGGRK
jgi:peptidoglycan hydrolase CwlO-like protein